MSRRRAPSGLGVRRDVVVIGERRSPRGWQPAYLDLPETTLDEALAEAARSGIDRVHAIELDDRERL